MKRHVICLGDSNTHGYCGAQEGETLCGGRFSEAERWPCLLQRALGEEYLVIEEGLCGRTTVFEDPLRDGRKGTALLPTLLETPADPDAGYQRHQGALRPLGGGDRPWDGAAGPAGHVRGLLGTRGTRSADRGASRHSSGGGALPRGRCHGPGMRGEVPSAGGALPPAGSQAGRAFPGRGGL